MNLLNKIAVASLVLVTFLAGSSAQAQPAPPLTQVTVYAVSSTGHPAWEYPPTGSLSTRPDQKGPGVWVAVLEVGYANQSTRHATFGGSNMTYVTQIAVVNVFRQVVGYVVVYYYTGKWSSAQFKYTATSLVVPIVARSTQILVQ